MKRFAHLRRFPSTIFQGHPKYGYSVAVIHSQTTSSHPLSQSPTNQSWAFPLLSIGCRGCIIQVELGRALVQLWQVIWRLRLPAQSLLIVLWSYTGSISDAPFRSYAGLKLGLFNIIILCYYKPILIGNASCKINWCPATVCQELLFRSHVIFLWQWHSLASEPQGPAL